ncbi:MAG: hypothetical protein HY590_03830 [Candidatus Omnitrophica bacterium]|nr:hypothetical protein [Candidatus Omnitrophota bacterium]
MNARGWVGEGFRSVRENLKVVFLFWLAELPLMLLSSVKEELPSLSVTVVGLLMSLLNFILGIGFIHYLKLKQEGQEATLKTLWKGGLSYFWRVVGLQVVIFGITLLLMLVAASPLLLLLISKTLPFQITGVCLALLILVISFSYFLLATAYAAPILIAESERAIPSLKKSYAFTRLRLWILTKMFLLWFCLLFLIMLVLGAVAALLALLFAKLGMGETGVEFLMSLLMSFPTTFLIATGVFMFLLFYLKESKPVESTK